MTAARSTNLLSFLEVPSIAERHVFEIAATTLGAKKVVRIVVRIDQVEPCSIRLQEVGLHVALPTRALAIDQENCLGDRYCRYVALDDTDATEAALVASLDRQWAIDGLRIDENGSVREIGELYGYPSCCVACYESILDDPDWIARLVSDHRRRMGIPPSISNKLAYLFEGRSFLPDYFPCSLYCNGSAKLAQLMRRSALEAGLSELVASAEAETRRPLVAFQGALLRPRSFDLDAGSLYFQEGNVDVFVWRDHADVQSTSSIAAGARCRDGLLTLVDASGATVAQDDAGAIIEFKAG